MDAKTHQLWKIEKRNLVQTMLIWMNKLRNLSRSLKEATTIIEITLKEADLIMTQAANVTTLMKKEEDDEIKLIYKVNKKICNIINKLIKDKFV